MEFDYYFFKVLFLDSIDPVNCIDARGSLFPTYIFCSILMHKGVQNKLINVDESIYIPITKAEYTVLVEAFKVQFFLVYKLILSSHCRLIQLRPVIVIKEVKDSMFDLGHSETAKIERDLLN